MCCLLVVFASFVVNAQNGIAVVELYTSQGCSSCPSADKLLGELIDQSSNEGRQIIGLSFHVDYWNYIGWKDPYSSNFFSQRQRNYSKGISSHQVYTPQMIVNGSSEFVGSNREQAEKIIQLALRQQPQYRLVIEDVTIANKTINLAYRVDKEPGDHWLNIALVERHLENYVPRGENKGRTLKHDNVVKTFQTLTLRKSGRLQISLKDEKIENCSVVLYIQNQELEVVGATQYALVAGDSFN